MAIRAFLTRMNEETFDVARAVDPDSCDVSALLLEDQDRTVMFNDLNGGTAVGNLFSTRDKMARFLGIGTDDLMGHLMSAMSEPKPFEVVEKGDWMANVTDDFDLTKLPIPRYFPEDGGRYITSGVIIAEYEGKRNMSFHRMMVIGKDALAVRLVPRHLFTMHKAAKAAGEELKISICVGLCPCALLAAASSLDYEVDELEVASALRMSALGEPMVLAEGGNGLLVPASCDYVFEGRITLDETDEGPFVDITGTYDHVRKQPIIKIDRMMHVDDPVFHLLQPGGNEHFLLMGMPREPVIFRTVRQTVPRTHAVRLTEGGCCWLNGVVSISKNKEGDGVNAIMAAFSGHPSMKHVIIVDQDIDIFDDRQVEWAMATRFQGNRLLVIPDSAGSSLDPSADGTTYKVGVDATMPLGKEHLFRRATLD